MKNTKHTKGPWKATNTLLVPWGSEYAQACLIEGITEDKQLALAIIEGPFVNDVLEHEGEANAHLIAAAPEMLEALIAGLSCIDQHTDCPVVGPIIEQMQRAIKKARGES